MQNVWAGIPSQEESSSNQLDCPLQKPAQKGQSEEIQRKEPAVPQIPEGWSLGISAWCDVQEGNQNLNFGRLNENKPAGPQGSKKAQQASKGLAIAAAKAPTKAASQQKAGKPVTSAPWASGKH